MSGFSGGKQQKTQDGKMKISCRRSHTHWARGFGVQVSFLWLSLTQDTEQDMTESGTAKCVCRGRMQSRVHINS